jgi:hypothetical protein
VETAEIKYAGKLERHGQDGKKDGRVAKWRVARWRLLRGNREEESGETRRKRTSGERIIGEIGEKTTE